MRPLVLVLNLLTTLAFVSAVPLRAADEELVAVMDLVSQGARPEEAAAITNQLRTQLLKTGKFTLVDRSQIDAILKEQALQQTGCTSDECAVQVGKILGVRIIVSGNVTKLSDQVWQISVLMLDVESAKTLRAETETYEGSLVTVIRTGVPDLAARLAGIGAPAPAQQAAITGPQQDAYWRDPITGIEFVYVPGGEYEQGCGSWTSDCLDSEKPTRRVRLSAFWLGKTEATQGQWKKVMGKNPSNFKKGDDYPVEQVSWNEVQEFVTRLNTRSPGVSFRLPSEAQWEYACRGGGKALKHGTQTGDLNPSLAKYGSQDGTVRVGTFAPNGLGLYDMAGNVREWTQDVYSDRTYSSDSSDVSSDPINAGSGLYRMVRGGSWSSEPRHLRCSNRRSDAPSNSGDYLGFRLARTK
jgi:formylglycine-generating enzyme required for sulfatase activity